MNHELDDYPSYADGMLDGTFCCECGSVRGPTDPSHPNFGKWEPEGVPRLCKDCRKDQYKREAMKRRRPANG